MVYNVDGNDVHMIMEVSELVKLSLSSRTQPATKYFYGTVAFCGWIIKVRI